MQSHRDGCRVVFGCSRERRARAQRLAWDHRSSSKRGCRWQDSNEQPTCQNVRFSLSLSVSCLLLAVSLAFVWLTSFYGNEAAKFSKSCKRLSWQARLTRHMQPSLCCHTNLPWRNCYVETIMDCSLHSSVLLWDSQRARSFASSSSSTH